ncbi:DNA helicase [Maudiozyma humilis]|uniref:ATP-dependent DNA helicase RRM3 n=1 Tax=Maudiozyma humilis TaxID=51915 RepID=A0AAV5S599_MAUHU|nr:DNA helicase [Kazachstania humilis]
MLRSQSSSSKSRSDNSKTNLRQSSIASFFGSRGSSQPSKSSSINTITKSSSQHSHAHGSSSHGSSRTLAAPSRKPVSASQPEVITISDTPAPSRHTHTASRHAPRLDRSRTRVSKPMALFSSQGSFDECDPDEELRKLQHVRKLNSYKQSLPRAPTLRRSDSQTKVLETELESDGSTTFKEVTSISGGSRQLSFTSTQLDLDTLPQSTQLSAIGTSRPSLKRNNSSLAQLNMSFGKRVKPLSNNRNGINGGASSSKKSKFPTIKLTKEQETVIDLVVNKKANIFYTGSAGTGKSVILRHIVSKLGAIYGHDAVAITASTGLAATTIGGVTLHKWSGIGIGRAPVDTLVSRVMKRRDLVNIYKNTRVLIIDEVSMIDGEFLAKIETIARNVRKSDRPFGGIQVVLTGDFFQLPPVQRRDDAQSYGNQTIFCFESSIWKRCVHKTILLTKVFRQQDNQLVDILNQVRFGNVDSEMCQTLRSLSREVKYDDGIVPTELYSTRYEVENSNTRQLSQLPGREYKYEAEDIATPEQRKVLDSAVMAERTLVLKTDAQVMMLKNRPEYDLVNGTLGKVLFFSTTKLILKMNELYGKLDDEVIRDMRLVSEVIGNPLKRNDGEFLREISARPLKRHRLIQELCNIAASERQPISILPYVRWSIGQGKSFHELVERDRFPVDLPGDKSGLERVQLPIMLCWALSIHKAQGQTIQRLKVDLKRTFEAGQVYVALSRAVSMDNLQVLNFNPKKIRANEKVKEFYSSLETIK